MQSQDWLRECSQQQRLADDTLRLLQEQGDARDLGLDIESDSIIIERNLSQLQKAKVELENRLSQAEIALEHPASVLAEAEAKLVALTRQIDLIEESQRTSRPAEKSTHNNLTNYSSSAEPRHFQHMNDHQVLQLQSGLLEEQDIQLDQLSNVIARQKEIGLMISDELDHQADLLDNTERNVDDSHNRVANARRRLDQLMRESKEKRTAFIIGTLVLILIIIIIVTKVK